MWHRWSRPSVSSSCSARPTRSSSTRCSWSTSCGLRPRPGTHRPTAFRRAGSPSPQARAPAPRSTSSSLGGPSRSCAAGPTCSRRTSSIWSATCCATASCSRTRRSRTTCPRSSSSTASSRRSRRRRRLCRNVSAQKPEAVLKRVDWTVIRRLDGLLQGDYRTLFRGHGLDLADIRAYEPVDDLRYIDWNVSARMDTPFVRQYLEDREITAHFLLDLSPSLDFGTTETLKRAQLVDFVAVIARLLTRHGNRVDAALYAAKVAKSIPAGRGRMQG